MPQQTRLAKWGNSLAVRIPHSVAREAKLNEGDSVNLSLTEEGGIILSPARRRYTLDELVSKITSRNRHAETEWGPPVGKETW